MHAPTHCHEMNDKTMTDNANRHRTIEYLDPKSTILGAQESFTTAVLLQLYTYPLSGPKVVHIRNLRWSKLISS